MATAPSSHLVLARKWRPERFGELVGQEHVTRTLAQALKSGRIAHAFLFTGIRGVGKTTAARIFARCLNCERGPAPEPCGECAACREIRAGAALDVVEIDGATYRKIDDARAIIENLSYRPARDRFKIYIIDEAHQLTDQAFNALLKTLEEPPAHVKFVLATTEPQKMPETILSRLQRYDFRRIPFTVILARLKELAAREGIQGDEAALSLLAREAGGSMRDAERMLETAIASLGGNIGESEVASILGVASRGRVFEQIGAILDKDAATALAAVRELHHRGANLESLGRDILEVLRNLTIAKLPGADGANSPLADLPDQEAAELRRLAERASMRDLMRLFKLMADAQEQLIRSPYPDLLLEMAVIRMATLAPVLDADELMRAIGAAGSGSGGAGGGSRGNVNAPSLTASVSGAARSSPAGAQPRDEAPSGGARRIPLAGEVKADAPLRGVASAAPKSSPNPVPIAAPSGGGELPELREFIRGKRAALFGFMEQGASLRMNGDVVMIIPRSDIYVRYLSDNRNVIAELASELYGRRIRAEIGRDGDDASAAAGNEASSEPTPSAQIESPQADATKPARATVEPAPSEPSSKLAIVPDAPIQPPAVNGSQSQAEMRQAVYGDPVVRRIFDEFEARLVEVRSRPASGDPAGEKK